MGVAESTSSNWERGGKPTSKTINRLIELLEITPKEYREAAKRSLGHGLRGYVVSFNCTPTGGATRNRRWPQIIKSNSNSLAAKNTVRLVRDHMRRQYENNGIRTDVTICGSAVIAKVDGEIIYTVNKFRVKQVSVIK